MKCTHCSPTLCFSTGLEKDAWPGHLWTKGIKANKKKKEEMTWEWQNWTGIMSLCSQWRHFLSSSIYPILSCTFLPLFFCTCAQLSWSNWLAQVAAPDVMEFEKVMWCPLSMTGDHKTFFFCSKMGMDRNSVWFYPVLIRPHCFCHTIQIEIWMH